MKKLIKVFSLVFLVAATFAACKDNPVVDPPGVFQITSINTYGSHTVADLSALASYQNYEGRVYVDGSVSYGDGNGETISNDYFDKGSGTWESGRYGHRYAAKGTYTVSFTLT